MSNPENQQGESASDYGAGDMPSVSQSVPTQPMPPYEPGSNPYSPQPRRWNLSSQPPLWAPWYGIGFGNAVIRFFRKAFVFHGRASRGEYWWICLFSLVTVLAVGGVSGILATICGRNATDVTDTTTLIAQLALYIPELSLSIRRLHDENMRGWWVLLPVLTEIGAFVALVVTLVAGAMMADGDDFNAQTIVVALLTFFGLYLLSLLISIIMMVMPSNPKGARFDRPYGRRAGRGRGERDQGERDRRERGKAR